MQSVKSDRAGVAYASVDSAPAALTGPVPRYFAPILIAIFVLLTLGSFQLLSLPAVSAMFPSKDLIFAPYKGLHVISVRLFILLFFICYAFFANSSWAVRGWVGLRLVGGFTAICLGMDAAGWLMLATLGWSWSLYSAQFASGLIGFALFVAVLLRMGQMPAGIPVLLRRSHQQRAILRLIISAAIAGVAAWQIMTMDLPLIDHLRSVALLGGLGPGIFLFLPLMVLQLFACAMWDRWRFTPSAETPPVTVIVPAYNESYIIERTIDALDLAASGYRGDVHVLILNNASTDATADLAQARLAECTHLTGKVLMVPKPGKANALNAGLDATETEFIIRVDADTVLMRDTIARAMTYFADPSIGVIGGLPLPPGGGLFDRPRLIEVLMRHGFYSVAMGAIEGVVSVPGMFAAYRTEHLRQVGGFVGGMNGEDTDASLRIGEMGFYALIDPRIRFISEVPRSYEHLREQRMRWFRSVFHVACRSRDVPLAARFTMRGKIVMPYMLLNTARRAMMVPLILFGTLDYVTRFNPDSLLIWQGILALTLGAPSIMAMLAAAINKRPDAILAIPEYLVFRVIRSYLTLESMLSISLSRQGGTRLLPSHEHGSVTSYPAFAPTPTSEFDPPKPLAV